jgi:hypothetical protein
MHDRSVQILHRWFETPEERRWLGALSVATALHATLLLALFLWGLDLRDETTVVPLDSGWSDDEAAADFDPLTIAPPVHDEARPDAGGSTARSLSATAVPSSSVRALPVRITRTGTLPAGTRNSFGANLLASVNLPTNGEAENGSGLGTGTGDGLGAGDAGGFFGMHDAGRSFVYVVDASSSMYAPHDSEARTRFGRVQVELVRSIGNMTPQQGFFVLFFNSVPHPMPARGLQPGLPRVKQRYLDWTARHRAGGDTNPLPALELALALQPDVVYFLTDGVLPRGQNVLREVTRRNGGRVRIHTFAFGSRTGEQLLRELATRNGGEYHFVE